MIATKKKGLPVAGTTGQEGTPETPSPSSKAYLAGLPVDLIISQDSPTLLSLTNIIRRELMLRIKASCDKAVDLKEKRTKSSDN